MFVIPTEAVANTETDEIYDSARDARAQQSRQSSPIFPSGGQVSLTWDARYNRTFASGRYGDGNGGPTLSPFESPLELAIGKRGLPL